MFHLDRRPRLKARRQVQIGQSLSGEVLEARRLLAASSIVSMTAQSFASGLPLPGLAIGLGSISTSTSSSTAASVAPISVASSPSIASTPTPDTFSATSPSTTLSPLMNDFETAVATASEVARPTPGRSDRISVILPESEVLSIILRNPSAAAEPVVPGPEVDTPVEAPVAEGTDREAPVDAKLVALPSPDRDGAVVDRSTVDDSAEESVEMAWDVALGLVAVQENSDECEQADLAGAASDPVQCAMATGVVLAAWGGWKTHTKFVGRSRRRAASIDPRWMTNELVAGPR